MANPAFLMIFVLFAHVSFSAQVYQISSENGNELSVLESIIHQFHHGLIHQLVDAVRSVPVSIRPLAKNVDKVTKNVDNLTNNVDNSRKIGE
jgi:hypothetical protein